MGKNVKRFDEGEIVYWHRQRGNDHFVSWGVVDEQFSDAVCIDLYKPKECRYVNGVFIDEIPACGEWNKLPKGWSYDTKLIDIEWIADDYTKNYIIDITNPENLKQAIADGMLVKANQIFSGAIETEISKSGWRIVKKYPNSIFDDVTYVSVHPNDLYLSYEEAQAEIDAYNAELQRQANLTDYEWSVELIDKELNRWAYIYGIPEDTKLKYKSWLLNQDNVEDIEVRISGGSPQWKYDRNRKWRNIELVL